MAGLTQVNGQNYVEREQTFPLEITVANSAVITTSLPLPGTANFFLKGLTRTVLAASVPVTNRPFRYRFGNSDGGVWYQSAGNGGTTNRVIDSLLFGNGQFPWVPNPYIFYSANASIMMEIEDLSGNTPYTIYFGFRGAFLLPQQG
jgi:hypothetical protein